MLQYFAICIYICIVIRTKYKNKYMERFEVVRIKEQIKPNILKGDFVTLGKMMGLEPDTARQRFNRDKEDAVLAMQTLLENRNEFIEEYQKNQ